MAGRGLGTLTLALAIQMGAFISGLDKAGRALDSKTKRMEKRAYEFGRAIGTSIKAGFAVAGTAVALYIKNTIDAQNEQAQLAAVLKSTGNAAGFNAAQLNKMAESLAKSSTFSAGEITNAQTRLLSYSNVVGDVFPRAMQAAIDQAARLGMGIEQSAELVGKALGQPTKAMAALAKQGFFFTEQQEELIKKLELTGDTAEAQRIIMGMLEESYGGAAQAARDTMGGALIALKNAFNDLMTGDSGDAGIEGTTRAINDLTDTLSSAQTKAAIDDIASLVVGLTADFARGVSGLVAFISQVRTLQSVSSGGSLAGLSDADLKIAMAGKQNQIQTLKSTGRTSFGPGASTLDQLIATRKELVAEYTRRIKADASLQLPGITVMDTMTIGPPGEDKKGKSKRDAAARKAAAEAKRKAAEAARELAKREDELADAVKRADDATIEFNMTLEDLIAAGDPLAEAQLRHNRELADLKKLAGEGSVSVTDLAKAENLLAEAYAKTTAEIKERLDTGGQQLKQMQQELDLLNMQTDAERVRAQFFMDHPTATSEQADAAVRMQQQIDETREAISAMDDFRSSFEDFVVAAANGKASFKDFADMVIQQIIRMGAAQLTASLFGQQGTTGGGWIGGLIGAFFGGGSSTSVGTGVGSGITVPGFATGTEFAPGGFALVGEHGPEIVNLPRGSQVTPNNKLGGMGNTINITVQGNATRETAQQIANQVGRKLIFAGRGT